jgi:protein TonB
VSVSNAESWFEAQEIVQQRVFVRALAVSFALHLGVAACLLFAPKPAPVYAPAVITVRMVSMPSSASAPAPAESVSTKEPAPVPLPAKPKPPPVAKKAILPKRAAPISKKPKPKPKPEPLEYDDALAALREELGEEATPVASPTVSQEVPEPEVVAEGSGGASGLEVDPAVLAWRSAVLRHVNKSLRVPQEFMNRSLSTVLILTLTSTGEILGHETVRSSDNPYWDDNVFRALDQASPLPPPPNAGDWTFRFTPDKH